MPRRRELPFPLNIFQSRRDESRSRVCRSRNDGDNEHRSRPEYSIESRGPNGTRRVWPPPANHDNSSWDAPFGAEYSNAHPGPESVRRTREEWVVREGEYHFEGVDESPPGIHGNHPPSDAQPTATHRTSTSWRGDVLPNEDLIESDGSSDSEENEMSAPSAEEDFHPDRQSVHCGHLSRTELLGIQHPSDLPVNDHDQQSLRCGSSSRLEQLGIQQVRPTAPARDDSIRPRPATASSTSRNARSTTANASTGPMSRSNAGTCSCAVQTEAMDQEPTRKPRHDTTNPPLINCPTPARDIQPRSIPDARSTPRHVFQDHRPIERGVVAGNSPPRPVNLTATCPELQGVNP
jgi:hypothetical protein